MRAGPPSPVILSLLGIHARRGAFVDFSKDWVAVWGGRCSEPKLRTTAQTAVARNSQASSGSRSRTPQFVAIAVSALCPCPRRVCAGIVLSRCSVHVVETRTIRAIERVWISGPSRPEIKSGKWLECSCKFLMTDVWMTLRLNRLPLAGSMSYHTE